MKQKTPPGRSSRPEPRRPPRENPSGADTRRADSKPADTRAHLARVLDSTPVILWAVDRHGTITLSEGRGLEALGLRPGQNVGRSLRELYKDVPGAIENLERALAGEQFTTIVRVRGLAFEGTYFPERDGKGNIVGASGISVNVTERIRNEEGLREAQRHLEHVAASAPILLWSIDRAGLFTFAQGRGFAALGVAPEAVTGRSAYEAFPDFPEALRYYERALEGETLSHHVSGRGVTLENLYFPDRDEAGGIVGVSGLSIDVTEGVHAEERVRLGRERLEQAQRLAQIGSWELDVVRDETRWSDEAYRIFRLEPASFAPTRSSILDLIHPEDRSSFAEALAVLEAGGRSELMCRIVRADGSEGIVFSRGEAERDSSGATLRIFGTVQDVTERETARREVRRAKESLAEAQRIARLGSWEWQIAPDRVRWSDEVFRMFGVPRDAPDLGEAFLGRLHPEDRERVQEIAQRTLESGAPYPVVRYRILHPSEGTRTLEQRAELVRDAEGAVQSMIGTVQDVTERRQSEETQVRLQEAVVRSAAEWRSTFDAVGSPILILDRDGRVRRPNRAARDLAGRPYTEIMGSSVLDVGPGPLWGAVARATEQVTATEGMVSLQVQDPDTGKTWDVSASPLTGPDVDGGGVIALARDVSPIVDLQESLRRSETMSAMGRLVAGVAHEVRNPLFGISATLDAFDADFSDRPEYREYSGRLRAEVGRLSDLMHDLLEYGRPTPPQLARGSLRAVIERAARACGLSARVAGVHLVTTLAPDLPEIDLDEGRLVQVYQNLIENAVQHSSRGSEVAVSASAEGDLFVATGVSDSGPGFREEDIARVFEPFFTRRRGGTGLGLSIVHRIVTEHGGHVQAGNRPGGGALIRVRLPCPAGPGRAPRNGVGQGR